MSEPVIHVENLGKQYAIGGPVEQYRTLRETILRAAAAPWKRLRQLSNVETSNKTFWALRDVNLDVAPGEVVGIIGRNGAGKSTLIKLLSSITEPTTGRIEIQGRVASLLEVGTGFHPELTGRENIYLNGSILGMGKAEIERKFDQIVEFGGVGAFIDTPAKRFSSGMQVRLGFAIAAHLEPDILIVDEVLAVADMEFQRKCVGKMEKVAQEGRTVLLVSHNMATLQAHCTKAIVLEKGRIIFAGPIQDAINTYLKSFDAHSKEVNLAEVKRDGKFQPIITKLEFIDPTGKLVRQIPTCAPLTVKIHYRYREPLRCPLFRLIFATTTGINVFLVQNHVQSATIPDIAAEGVVTCSIPEVPLLPGRYYITCTCGAAGRELDWVTRAASLEVFGRDVYGTGQLPNEYGSLVVVDAEWQLEASNAKVQAENGM